MSNSPTGCGSLSWREAYSNLKDYFGYTSFRSGQESAIGAAFDKKDSLVVMATGNRSLNDLTLSIMQIDLSLRIDMNLFRIWKIALLSGEANFFVGDYEIPVHVSADPD
jgi:hypothetical protein